MLVLHCFQATFNTPLTQRQTNEIEIKNDWNKAIVFKMKTTQPDAFKMKPVYGIIQPKEKKKVVLILKKWDANKKPKKSDHFTVVFAPAPEKCTNPSKTWKAWKQSKVSEAAINAARRQLKIVYNLEAQPPQKGDKKAPKEEGKMPKETAEKPPVVAPAKETKEKKVVEKPELPAVEDKPKKEKEVEKVEKEEPKKEEPKKKEKKKPSKKKEKEEEEEGEEEEKKKPKKAEKEEKKEEEEEEEDEEDDDDDDKKKKKKKAKKGKGAKDDESSEESSDDSE
ncbi:unnamed protein product [Anisakis simplex]|uniref:Major sperm protein n=1 Tax=Anisakis simplex TaxID=6269 RepID=A0A3P6NJA7_ANISI|nr:unnamed protein product [Anisakis simplex]